MFIRIFEKNLSGIIDGKNVVLTKNSKNDALHFKFNGTDFEDISTFEENVLIKKIPKNQIDSVNILPFYSILFEDKSLFIFQPMTTCNVLVMDDNDNLVKKDIVSLSEGDSVVFYNDQEEIMDFYLIDVEDISVFDTVNDQYTIDEEDVGFSGYVVGSENPNGLILNNLLLL